MAATKRGSAVPVLFTLVLFNIFNLLIADNANLLSRLYNQASNKNRPLILVLDNALGSAKDVEKQLGLDNYNHGGNSHRYDRYDQEDSTRNQIQRGHNGQHKSRINQRPKTDHRYKYLDDKSSSYGNKYQQSNNNKGVKEIRPWYNDRKYRERYNRDDRHHDYNKNEKRKIKEYDQRGRNRLRPHRQNRYYEHRYNSRLRTDDKNYQDDKEEEIYRQRTDLERREHKRNRDRRDRYRRDRYKQDQDRRDQDRRDRDRRDRDRRDQDRRNQDRRDQDRRDQDRRDQDRRGQDRRDQDRRDQDRRGQDSDDQDCRYQNRQDPNCPYKYRQDQDKSNKDRRDRDGQDRDRRDQDWQDYDWGEQDRREKRDPDRRDPYRIRDSKDRQYYESDYRAREPVLKKMLRNSNGKNDCEEEEYVEIECESSNEAVSTRGEKLVTEKFCPRC